MCETAHNVKSMSANARAEKVRQMSSNIENDGRNGLLDYAIGTVILIEPKVTGYLSEIRAQVGSEA